MVKSTDAVTHQAPGPQPQAQIDSGGSSDGPEFPFVPRPK